MKSGRFFFVIVYIKLVQKVAQLDVDKHNSVRIETLAHLW